MTPEERAKQGLGCASNWSPFPVCKMGLYLDPDKAVKEVAQAIREAVEDFRDAVNRRAEAEMLKTGNIHGAHHRAIETEIAAIRGEGT